LLATDFRPASQQAEEVAVRLAGALGAGLALLHVVEPMPAWPVALPLVKQRAGRMLSERAAQLAGRGPAVDVALAGGAPADAIVREAWQRGARLIVIGAGDRSPFDRFCVGPIAETVLEHAQVPVLAVRPGEPALGFGTLLCAVDQSRASAAGLAQAVRLARAFGSRLVVLSVVPAVSWLSAVAETGALAGARAEHDRRWRAEFDRFLEGSDLGGVSWEKQVRQGAPHQQIAAAAREAGADLLVLGSVGQTGLIRMLLGGVTRRVLRQLPCSVLVAREATPVEGIYEDDARHLGLLMAEGRQALAGGDVDSALEKFGLVLAWNPFHAPALDGLAEALDKEGKPEPAERCRRRAQLLRGETER
jgi:nucleotide-binding universal stress UspA family protein